MPPASSNGPGYPPALGPGEPIPGATTPIPKRPVPPADEKGTRFERRPAETSNTAAAAPDLTDNSEPPAAAFPEPKRLLRQTASAGFCTRVLTAESGRAIGTDLARNSSPFEVRPEQGLARAE
jgi:hypothetical protein